MAELTVRGAGLARDGLHATAASNERVYKVLRRRILDGVLPPGSRLVELQLANEFNVSRTPVREALKRLTTEGLVVVDALRGIVVTDVDAGELEDIFVIRGALEGLCARLASERITGGELTKLRMLLDMMRESASAERWDAMAQANRKFHDVVQQAAGNPRLRSMAGNLLDFVTRFSSHAFASEPRAEEVLIEHERLLAALEARNANAAESAAQAHIERVRSYLAHELHSAAVREDELGLG